MFSRAEDFCTKGGNGTIENLDSRKILETGEEVIWEQSWRFIKHDLGIRDTLDIVRRIFMRRGQPYFVVRYEFTWVNSEPDSLRFLWHFQKQTRFGKRRSRHEVGFAPGYGIVTRRKTFLARDIGYLAGMMTIGNPLATNIDTLADGTTSHMSPQLKEDFGSGDPDFVVGFIRFNPEQDIAPFEIAWIDTPGHYVSSLHSDSSRVRVDTTNVLDNVERYLFARSRLITFERGQARTMEYAIGRARGVQTYGRFPLAIPAVIWSDRSSSDPPRF
jgi:hypothetical protein